MAQINFATAQIIVENAMRANGYGGELTINGAVLDLEKSWTNTNPINYQILRDAIAKSIVDSLTAIAVTGTISTGQTTAPLGQNVTPSAFVNINTATPLPVARVGDTVTITSPAFLAWMVAVGSSLSIPPPPVVTGSITTGSATVNIGG